MPGMRWRLAASGPPRKFLLALRSGDEVFPIIKELAGAEELLGASITGIGAFRECEVGFYDPKIKGYVTRNLEGPLEVLSFAGNLTLNRGEPHLHAHVSLTDATWSASGGHLLSAIVEPSLELVLTEWESHPERSLDPETGLSLIDL